MIPVPRPNGPTGVLATISASLLAIVASGCGDPDPVRTDASDAVVASAREDLETASTCDPRYPSGSGSSAEGLFESVVEWVQITDVPEDARWRGANDESFTSSEVAVFAGAIEPGARMAAPARLSDIRMHSTIANLIPDALGAGAEVYAGFRHNLDGAPMNPDPRDFPVNQVTMLAAVFDDGLAFLGHCQTERLTEPLRQTLGRRATEVVKANIFGVASANDVLGTEHAEPLNVEQPNQNFPGAIADPAAVADREPARIFITDLPTAIPPEHTICVRTETDWGMCATVESLRSPVGQSLEYFADSGTVELWLLEPDTNLERPLELLASVTPSLGARAHSSDSEIITVDLSTGAASPCPVDDATRVLNAPVDCV